MSITFTIDATAYAHNGFAALRDEAVGATPHTYNCSFHNNGPSALTVTAISVDTRYGWMFDVSVSGLPVTLNAGDTKTFTAAVVPLGSGGATTVVACPISRIDITYTPAFGVPTAFTVYTACRIFDASATAPSISQDDFAAVWTAEGFLLGTGSDLSVLGLDAWGVSVFGHLGWYNTFVAPSFAWGTKNVFIHTPFGHGGFPDLTDIKLDQYLYTIAFGNPLLYSQWPDFRAAMAAQYPACKAWVYIGNMGTQSDSVFKDLENGCDAQGFADRFFLCQQPILGWPQLSIACYDDPYVTAAAATPTNPETTHGEGRFEAMTLIKNLFATEGVTFHVEPRGSETDSQWFSSNGFNRIMGQSNYQRTRPDWFTGSGGATDAHCGDFIIILTNVTEQLPYAIADCLCRGLRCVIGTFDYRSAGGTYANLYTSVMHHLNFILGGAA